ALWYSPVLFGNIWLGLTGRKSEDITREDGNKSMAFAIIPAAVAAFALALLTAVSGASTVADALILGSLSSLAFSGMSALNLVLFENRPLKLAVLNTAYFFVSWNIVSIVLTLWK
ncbi:MAG: DUF1761 domain-containing protein, partial [Sphaerochaetaceae bacterium]|nr:DUF1761 domain-containing protein [Sphaerochaetaceae bacterium]